MYTNARSILNKIDQLRATVFDKNPSFIMICESFVKNYISDTYLSIDGYQLIVRQHGRDTVDGKCRGLLIYVRDGIHASQIVDKKFDTVIEMAGISVPWEKGESLSLILVYRPPEVPGSEADKGNTDRLCKVMRELKGPQVWIGDLNLHIDWERGYSPVRGEEMFIETVQDLFWEQMVDFPTHRSGGLLDLVMPSRQGMVGDVRSDGFLAPGADHLMLEVDICGPVRPASTEELVPDWTKADMSMLKDRLAGVNWEEVGDGLGAVAEWERFKEILEEEVSRCVPMKRRRKGMKPWWMTRKVMRLIRKKRRLWRFYTTDSRAKKDFSQFEAYKKVQKEVQAAVKNAKKNYEKKLAKDCKKNPKAFWSYMKKKTSNRVAVGPLKDDQERMVTDSREQANILNRWYCSVFTREDTGHIPEAVDVYEGSDILEEVDITRDKVKKKLLNLKPKSAPGPDKISPAVLHSMADVLCVPLASIFNKCQAEGVVPEDWKLANVTPIFKKGSKSAPGNYRPVSLTCIICKVMESLIKDAIVEHLAKNSLIRSSQHGFTAGRSCLTNLLEYMEELTSLVEEGHSVDMFYLDFSKAFDLVPHRRLLVKLRGLGIQGKVASWVEEWLSDRKQRVVLNGEVSDWGDILSGVVQGSVLGPTLFLCFINDLDLAVDMTMAAGGEQRGSIIKKFADDTKWGRVVESAEDRACFQAGLDSLQAWADTWQMQYNVDKCHILHVGKNNRRHEYQLGGVTLESSKYEKDVGVIINDDLKPSLQCARAAAKANQVLGQISRGVCFRDKDTMLRLYKTYVRPHLEYCQAAWSPWTLGDKNVLEQVQQRAVKLMTNLRSKTYEGRLKELGLTSLVERRKRGDMITMYRIMTGKDKVDPNLWFSLTTPRSGAASTRQNTGWLNVEKPPRSSWELRRNQFSQRAVDDWNLLPDWVKQAGTVNSFKNSLDKHWE